MRTLVLLICAIVCLWSVTPAEAQAVEMAAKCDAAWNKLSDLVRTPPDPEEVSNALDALELDLLASCTEKRGKVLCYQCIDDTGVLRTVQLLHKTAPHGFELLGFGCDCKVAVKPPAKPGAAR